MALSPLSPHKEERLPFSIWAVSLAGFFLNFSSVIVFVCSPILLTQQLGFKDKDAGILEGTVEGFALLVRSFAGTFSDALLKRKGFLMWGYGLSVLSRFLLAPTTLSWQAIFSRYLEKLGNGLQASPREALISDFSPKTMLGRAYGLNRAFSMSGSMAGSLVMFFTFFYRQDFDVRLLIWMASFLGLISFCVLFAGVKEPHFSVDKKRLSSVQDVYKKVFSNIVEFPARFWKTLGVLCIFKLGYFSSNFMMLMLYHNKSAIIYNTPLYNNRPLSFATFSVLQCVTCSLFAYPLGRLSDKIDRLWVVALGFVLMIFSLGFFGWGVSPESIYFGILLYGLQLSMQGAMMALLSTTMPERLHGTGFGIFFFATGLSVLFTNNVIMKFLEGGQPFRVISICILLALCLLPFTRGKKAS